MVMSASRRRWIMRIGAPLAVALVAGCAAGVGGTASGTASSQEALLERARGFWAAQQASDSVKAWTFEELSKDPSWTLEAYLKRGGIVYDAAEVRKVEEIDGDRAKVAVFTRYSVPMLRLKGQEAVLQDEWRLIDGVWFHAHKRSVINPGS